MQFNSIGRSSNFAQAGKAAADDTLKAFIASRRNAPDYGKIVEKGMENRSAEKRAAILLLRYTKLVLKLSQVLRQGELYMVQDEI